MKNLLPGVRADARSIFRALAAACLFTSLAALGPTTQEPPPRAQPEQAKPTADAAKPSIPDDWIKAFQWRNIGPANTGGRIIACIVPASYCG